MSTARDSMSKTAALLFDFGFPTKLAKRLADTAHTNGLDQADVQDWLDEARSSHTLNNPLGFVRARLQEGDKLPKKIRVDPHIARRHRYLSWTAHLNGRAANPSRIATQTCVCGHVVWKTSICSDCGLCPTCCQCEPTDLDEE